MAFTYKNKSYQFLQCARAYLRKGRYAPEGMLHGTIRNGDV